MNVAAYYRVSSTRQAEKGTSIPDQRCAVERYAEGRGYTIVRSFEDNGITGTTIDRPAFQGMLRAAHAGEFEAVLVYDVSRWARTTEGTLVKERLRDAGLRIVFVAEGLGDTDDPYATELVEDVFASNAKAFSRKLSQMMPERMRSAVLNGEKGVGGRAPFGYRIQYLTNDGQPIIVKGKPQCTLVPDPDTAPIARRAFEMYAEGASTRDVAAFLQPYRGLMKATNIGRMLRNPRYMGANVIGLTERRKRGGKTVTKYNYRDPSKWAVREGHHEAIITKELYERVQARLDAMSAGKRRSRLQPPDNPFPQAMLRCANCGSVIEYHKSVNSHAAYAYAMCRGRRDNGAQRGDDACKGTMHFEDLKAAVRARIAFLLEGNVLDRALASYTPKPNPEIVALQNLVAKHTKSRDNLVHAIEEGGNISALVAALAKAEQTIKDAEKRLSALRALELPKIDASAIRSDARTIIAALKNADTEKVRALLSHIFAEIRIDLAAATELRWAQRTLKSKQRTLRMKEAKLAAAEAFDRIKWHDQGPVYFVYRWERAGAILLEKADGIAS